MNINFSYTNYHKINFTSYNRLDSNSKLSISTSFYHDYETLNNAKLLIENNFPNGANILVYAGSNGEEALSLDSMFCSPNKYNIFSTDTSKEAIDYAKRGIYGIHPLCDDGFIIDKSNINKKIQLLFKNRFYQIQDKNLDLDNLQDFIYTITLGDKPLYTQKYFSPYPEVKDRINFIVGDIKNIDRFTINNDKKTGAIFFRNALYQLTKNNLPGLMFIDIMINLTLI